MSLIINAIVLTLEMLVIFFSAFFVLYLIAYLLLPVERSLSKYIWDHTDSLKPVRPKSSFKKFSQRHSH